MDGLALRDHFLQVKKWKKKFGGPLVSYPSRWSLLCLFGFLYWSSSWQWLPHIGGCKNFGSLLRAGITVFAHFFCKMYFLYVSRSHKKNLVHFLRVFPPENGWLTWPMVLFVVFTEIEDSILNFCKALLLVCNHLINRSEDFGSGESFQKLRIESSSSLLLFNDDKW